MTSVKLRWSVKSESRRGVHTSVRPPPKVAVLSQAMTASQSTAGIQATKSFFLAEVRSLLHVIVRGFPRDDHVVNVALAHARRADANELRLLVEVGNGLAANV